METVQVEGRLIHTKSFRVFLYKSDVPVEEFMTEMTQKGSSSSVELSYENTTAQQTN